MSQIQGNLPFNLLANTANPIGSSGLPGSAGLGQSYQSAYNAALGINQANYGNIMAGYQGLAGNLGQTGSAIQAGYGNLLGNVKDILGAQYGPPGTGGAAGNWGIAGPAAQAIQNVYQQQQGQVNQDLQSRGLSNTSQTSASLAGPALQAQQAFGALGANLAQTEAGYESNLGLAGLGYANQASQQRTALGEQQLGFMNSVQAPYPNSQLYSNLLQQAGGYSQYQQQQAQQQRLLQQGIARSQTAGTAGLLGGGGIGHTGQLAAANAPMGGGGSTGGYTDPYGSQVSNIPGMLNYPAPGQGFGQVGGGYSAYNPGPDMGVGALGGAGYAGAADMGGF